MLYDIKKDPITGKTTVVSLFGGRRVPPEEEAWVLASIGKDPAETKDTKPTKHQPSFQYKNPRPKWTGIFFY